MWGNICLVQDYSAGKSHQLMYAVSRVWKSWNMGKVIWEREVKGMHRNHSTMALVVSAFDLSLPSSFCLTVEEPIVQFQKIRIIISSRSSKSLVKGKGEYGKPHPSTCKPQYNWNWHNLFMGVWDLWEYVSLLIPAYYH